jgi:hypothetical protein
VHFSDGIESPRCSQVCMKEEDDVVPDTTYNDFTAKLLEQVNPQPPKAMSETARSVVTTRLCSQVLKLEGRPKGAARSVLEVAAGTASPSSRGLWGWPRSAALHRKLWRPKS